MNAPVEIASGDVDALLRKELIDNKIIIGDPSEDDKLIVEVRAQLMVPYPTIMYLILSEKCNLACKYYFLGNGDRNVLDHQLPKMSRGVIDQNLSYSIITNGLLLTEGCR